MQSWRTGSRSGNPGFLGLGHYACQQISSAYCYYTGPNKDMGAKAALVVKIAVRAAQHTHQLLSKIRCW